jgi:hypothetical protein
LRVHTTRPLGHPPPTPRLAPRRRPPHRTIVFDTETTIDSTQRLNFGVWRYYVDRWDSTPGRTLVEAGVFYADDLPERDETGFHALVEYAASNHAPTAAGFPTHLQLFSRTEFIERVIWGYAHEQDATVVGFNLPFDLSRLGIHAGDARRAFRGGFSLRLFEYEGEENRYRPRVAMKTIDSRRQFIGFTKADGSRSDTRGHFCDVRTLAYALTDQSHSLETACAAFGVSYQKRDVTHGAVASDYIAYCAEDVEATAALYTALLDEYALHPIELETTKAFSSASVGKAYLAALGVRPVLEHQPDFPPEVLGYGMAAFFGGRAECRIRKVPVPVVYCDFLSLYPTANTLMGTWKLLTADRITTDDVTDTVRELLQDPMLLEKCFERDLWPLLLTLVELEPDGQVLPVRAHYDPISMDYGIGVNPYRYRGDAWYALGDVIAAVLLMTQPTPPTIKRAIQLAPRGTKRGLKSLALRGTVPVDPSRDDFFRLVIEERRRIQADTSRPGEERQRLDRFLKVLANATSFGILAEYLRRDQTTASKVTVHGPDRESFENKTTTPEDAGLYCFPPLASCVTAGARLMLALLERKVTDQGGSYAFCDTDSMAIVATQRGDLFACPGGSERLPDGRDGMTALSWRSVDVIVEGFAALNPYEGDAIPRSILQLEEENYDADTSVQDQLWCYAISAKRYTLFNWEGGNLTLRAATDLNEAADQADDTSAPGLRKPSEHGLGHLLNPTELDPDNPRREWISITWDHLLRAELGLSSIAPAWFDTPAISRITVSTPTVRDWFRDINRDRPYADQIKPANFLLLAHPQPFGAGGALPVAPYEADPTRWIDAHWIDRHTGQPVRISIDFDGTDRPGVVPVRGFRDVLGAYRFRPETKSLAPDGSPVVGGTQGLLRRRPIEGAWPPKLIGKEGNKLAERQTGVITDPAQYRTEYAAPSADPWHILVVPVLAELQRETGIDLRHHVDLSARELQRIVNGEVVPHRRTRRALVSLAAQAAGERLSATRHPVPRDPMACLYAYVRPWG